MEQEPLLKARPTQRTGPSLANGYSAVDYKGGVGRWKHFTQRGHRGPVQALASSATADFIVTGGVDYSVRVFEIDYTYEAYALVAVFHVPVPEALKMEPERQGCIGTILGFQPSAVWDEEPPQGVTALTMVHSRRTKKLETTVKIDQKEVRLGPIVTGTAHGSVYILDLSSVSAEKGRQSNGVFSESELHDGKVMDICMLPLYPTHDSEGTEVLVMTAGEDMKAVLLHLTLKEVAKPMFEEEDPNIVTSPILDVLFYGGGGMNSEKANKRDSMRSDRCLKYVRHETRKTIMRNEPILQVGALIHETGASNVCFCCLTTSGVHLFNDKGDELHSLKIETLKSKLWDDSLGKAGFQEVRCAKHSNLAVTTKSRLVHNDEGEELCNQSLILVSGESGEGEDKKGYVAVWGLQDGLLARKLPNGSLSYTSKLTSQQEQFEPICVYNQEGKMLGVDQSGASTTFAAQLHEDNCTVQVFNTEAVDPTYLAQDVAGPASLLICPGREQIQMDLEHPGRVYKLMVIEDDEGLPALVTACETATAYVWDLEGDDREQIYAELRSLTPLEIILTPALLIITAVQMMSFAFVPETNWHDSVKSRTTKFHAHLFMGYAIKDKDAFWWQMQCVCSIIIFFLIVAFFGVPERLDHASRDAQCSAQYKLEQRSKPCWRPASTWARIVSMAESFVWVAVSLLTTIGVVPVVKVVATAVHCNFDHDMPWWQALWEQKVTLHQAPDVMCFYGAHLHLCLLLLIIMPAYFFFLVPYAVVEGDSSYVPNKTVFRYKFWQDANPWRLAAARKATNLHLAFMHMSPRFAFWTLFVELVGKVTMPLMAVWFSKNALVQMSVVSFIGFVMWLSPLVRAPYVERKFNVLLQALKLISFLAMATGLFTVIWRHPDSKLSLVILGGGTSLILVSMSVQLHSLTARQRPIAVFQAEAASKADVEKN